MATSISTEALVWSGKTPDENNDFLAPDETVALKDTPVDWHIASSTPAVTPTQAATRSKL